MRDMHVHTLYSSDADVPMQAYAEQARKTGVKVICFTDHVDNNPYDYGSGYYDSSAFFTGFRKAKAEAHDVKLLAGIEFDCPHRYQSELSELSKQPYDCIIGSVHYCGFTPDLFFSELIKNGVTAKECFAAYWKETLKCVTLGGFDVLGHIDFPKRYYKELIYEDNVLREIFRVMLSKGIIPEINTSSLRKGLNETMPGRDILELYRAEGGKYVTVGSDAHSTAELAAGVSSAHEMITDFGLREVIFVKRKMVGV